MAIFTQSRFPALWTAFQFLVGGTIDKRKLCCSSIPDNARVLEIGCSTGNITPALCALPIKSYTGLDIDEQAINYAQRRFIDIKNAEFICSDLTDYAMSDDRFDIVLFAGILHHIDDVTVVNLLRQSGKLLDGQGKVIVIDPLLPTQADSWLLHKYIKLERGEYLRTGLAIEKLLRLGPGLNHTSSRENIIGASPLSWPNCARFGVYELTLKNKV